MPGLRDQLVTHRMFTPFDFRDELGAHLGSAFSVEPILTQSARFRPHNRDSRIPNLYLVGAGTHPAPVFWRDRLGSHRRPDGRGSK